MQHRSLRRPPWPRAVCGLRSRLPRAAGAGHPGGFRQPSACCLGRGAHIGALLLSLWRSEPSSAATVPGGGRPSS
eukprot:14346284-Alexandrium_andersonii.AAC.1